VVREEDFTQGDKLAGWTAYLQQKIDDTLPNYPK
jgi:hypothetical protein